MGFAWPTLLGASRKTGRWPTVYGSRFCKRWPTFRPKPGQHRFEAAFHSLTFNQSGRTPPCHASDSCWLSASWGPTHGRRPARAHNGAADSGSRFAGRRPDRSLAATVPRRDGGRAPGRAGTRVSCCPEASGKPGAPGRSIVFLLRRVSRAAQRGRQAETGGHRAGDLATRRVLLDSTAPPKAT